MSEILSGTEPHRLQRSIIYVVITTVVVFLGYAATMSYLSVQKWTNNISSFLEQNDSTPEYLLAASDTLYFSRLSEASFLKSRVAMTAHDSACLSIDLKNKKVMVELQGVPVYESLIKAKVADGLFTETDGFFWVKTFSQPISIDSSVASISKQTFLVKNAPLDSSDIQPVPSLPDTAQNQAVFFTLFLANGINVTFIDQQSKSSMAYKKYAFARKFIWMSLFLKSVFQFKIPEYRPAISIEIPARDAKTIYKSLPYKTLLSLRIS